ncbi:division/cell wall cluster transcriptional repressor MraZ [Halodurantibacterium flavum]|uniref:Transcriptional regulator MraZ n=1 Tax=Halodurantibacterium flavum TaxID=1382802 RepID=A0ABW4S739_9RHOB
MAHTFRGEFNQKVDAKGRVSIPAPFRRVLEAGDPDWADGHRPRFVIVYGDERRKFLECYTISAMREVEAQIARLPRGSGTRRLLERVMITLSHSSEVDEDGRIVLPQKLRDKIGLSAEAVFAGALDTFQIWQPETYEADLVEAAQAELEALPEGADILSLLGDLPGD